MTTNLPQQQPSGSLPNSDLQLISSWLLQLSRFCDPLPERELTEKVTNYSRELLEDVPVKSFSKSTLAAARKRFTKFPSYPKLLEILPVYSEDSPGDSAAKMVNQRNNCLAHAAAGRWFDSHNEERLASFQGGYEGDLLKWLVVKYFEKARAGLISGRFEVGKGYVLDRFESITVPGWLIDSWLEREAEKRECRKALNKRAGSGFRQIGGLLK